jgi:hypothetical protein
MYTAKILSVAENPNNPDQISVIVEYNNGEKHFTRQYDWISNTVSQDTIELTIKDELKKMNVNTPSIIESLIPKIGQEIIMS